MLYYKVPGWPIGFGDKAKAKELLQKALAINPQGIDANYFYGEYLVETGKPAEARAVPGARARRRRRVRAAQIADAGRREEAQGAAGKDRGALRPEPRAGGSHVDEAARFTLEPLLGLIVEPVSRRLGWSRRVCAGSVASASPGRRAVARTAGRQRSEAVNEPPDALLAGGDWRRAMRKSSPAGGDGLVGR
ncbi:MAG: hypothetical protein MZW92_55455 [Comamonadaceae bacterium]|nr:hypothetical protein [Comamonadaceae bacterium]